MDGPAALAQAVTQLRPSAEEYADAGCGLCGAPLYIVVMLGRPVFLSDTAEDIAAVLTAPYTSTWRIECEEGHVILLPPDAAADYNKFGPEDLARLREVTA